MKTTEKVDVRRVFKPEGFEVSFHEEKENLRNGLVRVKITHEAQTLPNSRIKDMAEMGYIVSCVCGKVDGKDETTVYFEPVKATF